MSEKLCALKKVGGSNGSGGDGMERLCYVDYVGKDAAEIPTIKTIDTGSKYSEYLSYNSTTKKFTVLKNCNLLFVPWVYSYKTAQSSYASGAFYINNINVASFACATRQVGDKAGTALMRSLSANDTFYSYTPSSSGYPEQRLKVYYVEVADGLSIDDVLSFTDEEA